MELTFPRCHRLKSHRAIRAIKHRPTGRRRWPGFRLVWRTQPQSDTQTQFAFVVSRHSGKAHVRNRIKRRLREAVRLNKAVWPKSTSVVFSADGDVLAYQKFGLLNESISQAFDCIAGQDTKT